MAEDFSGEMLLLWNAVEAEGPKNPDSFQIRRFRCARQCSRAPIPIIPAGGCLKRRNGYAKIKVILKRTELIGCTIFPYKLKKIY